MNLGIELVLIAFAILILGLIYYSVTKENEVNTKLRAIARAVEDLHREVYKLEKRVTQELEIVTSMQETIPQTADLNHAKAAQDMSEMSVPIMEALGHIEGTFTAYKEKTENRLRYLEERIRNLSLPTSISGLDDEKVISRYNQGMDVDLIAKELRLSKPEVEFVLKINQLR